MVADRPQRLQAASTLAAFLNTPTWQQVVATGDYRSDQQIVLALESDTFADIRPRVERYEPPVHLAVYYPPAPAESRLCFLVLEPASLEGDLGGDVVEVDPAGTAGMFCTYMERHDRGVPVRLARRGPHLVARVLAGARLRG